MGESANATFPIKVIVKLSAVLNKRVTWYELSSQLMMGVGR